MVPEGGNQQVLNCSGGLLIGHPLEYRIRHTHRHLRLHEGALRNTSRISDKSYPMDRSLTQRGDGTVPKGFPNNSVYDGQQWSIL